MYKTILMILLTAVSSSAVAEWVKVSVSENFVSYANPATIRKNDNRVEMWCLYDFNSPRKMGDNKPHLSMKGQNEFDCKKKEMRILSASFHSGVMGEGEVIRTNSEPGKWEPVLPGSAGETLYKTACEKR